MDNLSVLITGGGTGGHIFPGISLYWELKSRGMTPSMLIGKKDILFSPLAELDKKDINVYGAPSFTKNPFKMPFFIIRFLAAVLKVMILIKKLKINAVIGMGGYVSAPALVASVIQEIPVFLCEQNSVPGKVTLAFAGKAKKIFTTLNITKEYIKEEFRHKVIVTGNPVRKNIFTKAGREEAKKFFHLGHCKNVILVIGGSQGALQINELLLEIKKLYSHELKDTGIIWITGSFSYKRFNEELNRLNMNGSIYISPFIDEIGLAYKASDLAISRSGSGGIMEFAAVGLPSILIPYPYAADNHQEKNAEVFERAGASIRIRKDEMAIEKFGNIVIDLLSNQNKLSRIAAKARTLAKIDAAKDIIDSVISVVAGK